MKEVFFPPGMIERVMDDCDPRKETADDASISRLWTNVSSLWGFTPERNDLEPGGEHTHERYL